MASKHWVGYVRVSHVGGRAGESFRSPDDQAAAIEGWAAQHDGTVTVLPAELDASGGDRARPILNEAIAAIERGEYCGLIVAYLSRASRSVSHLLEIWDRIEAVGGQVIAVAESIDTSTPAGRLTRTMLAAIAEHELDLHKERFDELAESATARGVWQRSAVPIGYVLNPETRGLMPGPDADLVRAAFAAVPRGDSMASIAKTLGRSNGGAYHMLSNRVYLGELRVRGYVNATAHKPLITPEAFLAAQRPRQRKAHARKPDGGALLAGLTRCASCGHAMSRATTPAKHGRKAAVNYYCRGHYADGYCPKRTSIACHLLDDFVEAAALLELAGITARSAGNSGTVDDARVTVERAAVELAVYVEAVSAADIGADAFAAGAKVRRAAVDDAEQKLTGLLGADSALLTADLPASWPSMTVGHRNRVLSGLLECVVVHPGRGAVADRAQIIVAGSDYLPAYRGGGARLPIKQIVRLDTDDPRVLRV